MSANYLYFRTEATDANDDATGDSICLAAGELTAMEPTGDSELTLYFNSKAVIKLNLTTANTHLTAIQTIVKAISRGVSFIVVANDDSGGTEYLADSGIASCGTITLY
jgi:hypothetical protein